MDRVRLDEDAPPGGLRAPTGWSRRKLVALHPGRSGVRWGREGREIFFVTGETLVCVPIEIRGDALTVGPTQALFEVPTSPTAITFRDYDYDPKGDRFLFTRPPRAFTEPREIAVSLGWAGRLKERVK